MAPVIYQIPGEIKLVIGGAAGKRLEMFAIGRDTLNRVKAVRFRQARVKNRAAFDVVGGGGKAELTKVGRLNCNGRTF